MRTCFEKKLRASCDMDEKNVWKALPSEPDKHLITRVFTHETSLSGWAVHTHASNRERSNVPG